MNGNSHKRAARQGRHRTGPLAFLRALVCGSRHDGGQAIVEYAIVFPIQLMLTLGVIQLAHLFVAKQVLEYGAYCGARAKMIGLSDDDARTAALIPISKIAGVSGVSTPDSIILPGWGTLPKFGAAAEKTQTDFRTYTEANTQVVSCTLQHNYELAVPVGNLVVAGIGSVFLLDERDVERYGGAPHIRMRAYAALPKP